MIPLFYRRADSDGSGPETTGLDRLGLSCGVFQGGRAASGPTDFKTSVNRSHVEKVASDIGRRTICRRALLKLVGASTIYGASNRAAAFDRNSGGREVFDLWDLQPLFPTSAAWTQALLDTSRMVETLAAYGASVRENQNSLGAALDAISRVSRGVDRLRTYADCAADAATDDHEAHDRSRKAAELLDQLIAQTTWVDETIPALGSREIASLITADRSLDQFRFDLRDRLRLAPHRLSRENAGLIAAARGSLDAPHVVYNELVQIAPAVRLTDASGQTTLLDAKAFQALPPATDQEERRRRSEAVWESRASLEGAFAATLDAAVRESAFEARSRGYASSLEAALGEPNIPTSVYTTMTQEVDRALPVLHRYYDIRRKMLGLEQFRLSDRSLPLTGLDLRYDLRSMRRNMIRAVQPLGRIYSETLSQVTLDGWMDAFPRPNKRDANYTNPAAYDVHPYLLLNLSDKFVDMTLFTHEWGHAMHAVLANRVQPYPLSNSPLLTRETASTCNEQLLIKSLIDSAETTAERLFYLAHQMEGYSVIFFNNAMIAEFESSIHGIVEGGGSLSGTDLTGSYSRLQRRFFGPATTIDAPHGREWMYIDHFYTPFYNFQYVPCIAAASYFAGSIRSGNPVHVRAYLSMLEAGGSDYGYNLLRQAGVDLSQPEPYRALVADFSETMDQVEHLLASTNTIKTAIGTNSTLVIHGTAP